MKWKFEKRAIRDLKLQSKNPRRLSQEQKEHLQKSISAFGLPQPIVINRNGVVIGGHQRVAILKLQGEKEADCAVPESLLSEKEVDELSIRLNKNAGSFDFDMLANAFDPHDLVDWGFSLDELHLEEIPEKKETPKICQLTARFENEDDLRQAEMHIATIIDQYASASYKVKVK